MSTFSRAPSDTAPDGTELFSASLDAAAVFIPDLDNTLDRQLIVGNGDVQALIGVARGQLVITLSKNDVWDARLFTGADPPLPTLRLIKELGRTGGPVFTPPNNADVAHVLPPGTDWQGQDSYTAYPHPCPLPCARVTVALPAGVRVGGHLDLRRGAVRITAAQGGEAAVLAEIRALAHRNALWIRTALPVALLAVERSGLPRPTSGDTDGVTWIHQQVPGDEDWSGMSFAVACAWSDGSAVVSVVTSFESGSIVRDAVDLARSTARTAASELTAEHEATWTGFWARSSVAIDDALLQRTWYRNLYFLRCVIKPGVQCPGLYAGVASDAPFWHGDYHTNYNVQQTFWGCFAADHLELLEPYERLVLGYLPRAEWLARQVYGLPGAFYPHVLFPYEPPDPDTCRMPNGRQYLHHVWGLTLGLAAFAVQPVWWRYRYAPDLDYLRETAYPLIRSLALFYCAFIDTCDVDLRTGRVRLGPSVSPEHWAWRPSLDRNYNCAFDIAMIRFALRAAIEGANRLGCDASLAADCRSALERLPAYPVDAASGVVVDVQGAPPIEYNIPVPAIPVFPGEDVTFTSDPGVRDLFRRTVEQLRWNGNNATVMLAVVRARLGLPEAFAWLKSELRSRERDNGTLALNRLHPPHPFNAFGHYTEQFGVTAAVSELLLQSDGGVIRVFSGLPGRLAAAFRSLRAQGGFLVSAEREEQTVQWITVTCTSGGELALESPWPHVRLEGSRGRTSCRPDGQGIIRVQAEAGETFTFRPA